MGKKCLGVGDILSRYFAHEAPEAGDYKMTMYFPYSKCKNRSIKIR